MKNLYKFDEDKYVEELMKVIDSTYSGHYSRQQFQATEFIIDGGHGTGFCIGNIMKYAQRYGKKGTSEDARKDLLKVLHYGIIQLHVHDINNEDNELSENEYDWYPVEKHDLSDSDEEYKYDTD
tara:strand:- start:215 stop:586 length:372 start_codon:yes stop_codon:yes gene_type:complete